jgi:hypothetical protein
MSGEPDHLHTASHNGRYTRTLFLSAIYFS